MTLSGRCVIQQPIHNDRENSAERLRVWARKTRFRGGGFQISSAARPRTSRTRHDLPLATQDQSAHRPALALAHASRKTSQGCSAAGPSARRTGRSQAGSSAGRRACPSARRGNRVSPDGLPRRVVRLAAGLSSACVRVPGNPVRSGSRFLGHSSMCRSRGHFLQCLAGFGRTDPLQNLNGPPVTKLLSQ